MLNALPSSASSSLAAQLDARVELAVGDLARGRHQRGRSGGSRASTPTMPKPAAASPATPSSDEERGAVAVGQRRADLRERAWRRSIDSCRCWQVVVERRRHDEGQAQRRARRSPSGWSTTLSRQLGPGSGRSASAATAAVGPHAARSRAARARSSRIFARLAVGSSARRSGRCDEPIGDLGVQPLRGLDEVVVACRSPSPSSRCRDDASPAATFAATLAELIDQVRRRRERRDHDQHERDRELELEAAGAWSRFTGVFGPEERLRADPQHAVGVGDLGVDEHRHERAEERAAAIEAAAGALAEPAPDLGERLLRHRVELDDHRRARTPDRPAGRASRATGRSSIAVSQLERLGAVLDLDAARPPGSSSWSVVDLVPHVVDHRALRAAAPRPASSESCGVDPDADHDGRRDARVERLVGRAVEQLADPLRGRRP